MTTEAAPKKPTPQPRSFDEPLRVKELRFSAQGGVDLPNELGQRVARLMGGDRGGDKPRFEILFVPRMGMYFVRAFAPKLGDGKPGPLTHEFVIPREWALADLELQ